MTFTSLSFIQNRRKFALSLCLLPLCGCAALGDYTPSNPLDRFKTEATTIEPALPSSQDLASPPQNWAVRAPSEMPTTDWVSSFDSQVLSPIVNEALEANTDVRAAEASWRAARASAIAARSDLLPSVDFSSRISRSESLQNDANSLSLGVGASWEVDMWGRVRNTADIGEINAQASRAQYAATRLSIAGQTAQSWFNLIEARLLLDLANKELQTQERALSLTQRRFEGGISDSTDVRLARSSLASSQASLATRKQQRSSAARSLEILLRRYPDDAIKAITDLPPLPPLAGAGLTGDILLRRPDLIAAERDMEAQGLQIDIARKNLLPRLSLSADFDDSATSLADLFDIDSLVASIAAGLTAPIFNSGALKADVERNEALLERLVENYVGTVLDAYLEVENALDAETRLEERESALRVSLDEAQKAESRLATRYSEGLATILELLDSQSRAISAESQLISARKERLANRVGLHLALGGGQFGAAHL